jgi:hypothetical protein
MSLKVIALGDVFAYFSPKAYKKFRSYFLGNQRGILYSGAAN